MRAPNAFDLAAPRPALLSTARRAPGGAVVAVDWGALAPRSGPPAEAAALALVMEGRFGYKPDVLFAYALGPADEAAWDGALKAALRELRRHFHVTLMNVGHLRLEDAPDIDFQARLPPPLPPYCCPYPCPYCTRVEALHRAPLLPAAPPRAAPRAESRAGPERRRGGCGRGGFVRRSSRPSTFSSGGDPSTARPTSSSASTPVCPAP